MTDLEKKILKEKFEGMFVQLPIEAITDKKLTKMDLSIYGLIRLLRHKKGYCWASNETIAIILGFSRIKTSTSINKLIKLNYLQVSRKSEKSKTRYLFDNFEIKKYKDFSDLENNENVDNF